MTDAAIDFWTDETSVLFTSFWGWSPETWGTVGWSGDRGKTRRTNLLKQLTDPFITVCYVTSNKTNTDPKLKGMIAGFMLVTHETGDRDAFTHPIHHARDPGRWRHSLQAERAFSYLPEYRLSVAEFDPGLVSRARTVSAMGEILIDRRKIAQLQETPWIEVEVYSPDGADEPLSDVIPAGGMVRPGPAAGSGYVVAGGTRDLPRDLYVLRLQGDTDAYLGHSAEGRAIYKIGLAASPDMRRQAFQKSMPRGAFAWLVERTSSTAGWGTCPSFDAAVAGETAMKKCLVKSSVWLGGEFYLATEADIESAWREGHAAVLTFVGKV
jgi:hypothetical protein